METEGRHERGTDEGERDTEVVVYGAGGAEVRRVGVEDSPAPIELAEGERAAVVWAGTHELALMGSGERVDARDEVVMAARLRHGFTERDTIPATALEHAILTDDEDPLAAASGTMRDPSEAPAVVRAAEQDASLGNLTIPAAPGEFSGGVSLELPAGEPPAVEHGDPWSGDPGDEQPHHVETVRVVVIRDGEGEIGRVLPVDVTVELAHLKYGETVQVEEWPAAAAARALPPAADERPVVYAPYGSLTDDALERLEELGLRVEEIGPDDGDPLAGPDLHTDQEWDELAVADTAADGTVRELRLLEGGAVDLTPRRKVQVWIDLRFQYVSDHPYGAPDTLEEERMRTIGAFVEQFATMTVNNRFEAIEGMQIQSVVGHILDKPGDPFPAAS